MDVTRAGWEVGHFYRKFKRIGLGTYITVKRRWIE